ncbi:D-alanine--poly(phosphoribitol) ligase subunit 2 [Heyndrickxia ginsengihumi]|uniref:D-alanyl carrier protein n=1 Tax=Heyndrickxia ginsengihumi TaxID=363870 RepID=A0A0A6VD15_9BACI|nr:D-alanine--poly(phosphoribitol) ligase subunit 2 [Heyndrickxia ginsengihumi]KHD84414.1 alanine-phosphoribitol ligase [Heyndrickxia ginsengihumi]MBE6185115.1 D-alanine--poly(phosphoribitol) ligase subunit 2 [Bacillus sp. (in: firmicutes)]MCM3024609.1 D-alanine--poly(phosphoribitol) ligase subunit 2 [Heyndrickxia ginsengihumi]
MEKQEVFNMLAEVCQDDVVVNEPDIDLFEHNLLDSFGIITLLVEIEGRFGISIPITEFTREEWNTPNQIARKLAERE